MNHGKQPMSLRNQKKVNKEVRNAQTAAFATTVEIGSFALGAYSARTLR